VQETFTGFLPPNPEKQNASQDEKSSDDQGQTYYHDCGIHQVPPPSVFVPPLSARLLALVNTELVFGREPLFDIQKFCARAFYGREFLPWLASLVWAPAGFPAKRQR
jgi:hypothetical protein